MLPLDRDSAATESDVPSGNAMGGSVRRRLVLLVIGGWVIGLVGGVIVGWVSGSTGPISASVGVTETAILTVGWVAVLVVPGTRFFGAVVGRSRLPLRVVRALSRDADEATGSWRALDAVDTLKAREVPLYLVGMALFGTTIAVSVTGVGAYLVALLLRPGRWRGPSPGRRASGRRRAADAGCPSRACC